MFDLSGRTALVTGAGQNVGEGIAHALAAQGALVAVNDVRADRAGAVADAIASAGGRSVAAPFDVTDTAGVLAAVAELGAVDILVCNAGNGGESSMAVAPFVELDPADWEGAIRVNLYGVLNCCHTVVAGMCERGWGRVITISSGAGTAGTRIGVSPYRRGRAVASRFTRTLALEVARQGVTANTVALGLMGLPDPEVTGRIAGTIPVGRTGTPADVAATCVWLASDEAAWMTAQTIQLNGGSITT